jgi:predicted neuraminidase
MRRLIAIACVVGCPVAAFAQGRPGLIHSEFIYEKAPFPSCHASTVVETPTGLAAAWFGGTAEGKADVGIWVARRVDGQWTAPVEAANGLLPDGKRHPCWNPVLFQPKSGDLILFYKIGPSPSTWWGMTRASADGGKTWSDATRLPDGVLGPIKNKPIALADGSILSPSSAEGLKNGPAWRIHFERSADAGKTWTKISVPVDADAPSSIQPSILRLGGKELQALGRTRSGRLFTTKSTDLGQTWSKLQLLPLPNPNSGTDAVTLADGRHLLVYNHAKLGRSPLNLAVSKDGDAWQAALALETQPGEYSYPAIIQTADGLVHATYTWKRQKVKHVVIDPAKLEARDFVDGNWPNDARRE